MTRLASAVTTSGPDSFATSAPSVAQRHEPMLDDFAVQALRREIVGQPQVVDEDRLALQTVRLLAAEADRARERRRMASVRVDAGFLPALP